MKTTIQSKVILIIMLFAGIQAQAHDFEVGGIYYGISIFNKNTAYVTHQGTGYNDYKEYSGSVVIPESVTYNGKSYTVASIGGYAFYGCDGLTSVTIPATVNTINQNAFNGCTGLMDIECKATTPPTLGNNAFTSYTATLKVPESSKTAYKSAEVWKFFKYYGEEGGNDDNPTDNSGLNYNIISPTEVEVIAGGSVRYSGDIVIPNETTIDGNKYTVTKIGDNAFDNCADLTSVEIPNTVKIIGNKSFLACKGLSSVVIPNSVTKIGENAFTGCNNLTSIAIGNSVANIDGYAFVECDKLSAVYITNLEAWCKIDFVYSSSNPLNYAKNLYLNNEKIINLEIPNTVTAIKKFVFSGCTGLTSITIPSTVTNIENFAFSGCTGLTSVTSLNPTPPTCGTNVFDGVNTQNIPLTVPAESVELYKTADTWKDFKFPATIGDVVEYEGLTYKVISETTVEVIAGAYSYTGDIVIPSEITIESKKYTVTSIGISSFSGCTELKSINIPNSVTNIGVSAFYGCTGLTSVNIPNTITIINNYVFRECSNLANITIPNSVLRIGEFVFSGCSSLTSINIPNFVTNIGNAAFSNCTSLNNITIGNSVTGIGDNAFTGCTGLASVTSLNTTPPTCGVAVFYNVNTQNVPLTVPSESVELYKSADTWKDFGTITGIGGGQETNIGDVVEYEGLTYKVISETEVEVIAGETEYTGNIVIPSEITIESKKYTVTSIGIKAFYQCIDLKNITISNTIVKICNEAFMDCTGLTSVNIPNSVTLIGVSAFYGCTGLTSVNIPNTVTGISSSVFSGCVSLINVSIPNSVTSIGASAFSRCNSIIEISIPTSVTNIRNSAFSGCTGLTSVTSLNPTPPTCGTNVFDGVNTQNIPLTVPAESVELYKTADTWKDFKFPATIGDVVEYEGLTYKVISETTVEVIAGAYSYTGDIVIPSEITINEKKYTVSQVGNSAFNQCVDLTSITISATITRIEDNAFKGCIGLTSVTSLNQDPPRCGTDVFKSVGIKNIPLFVPNESINLYKATEVWKDFSNIVGLNPISSDLNYNFISDTEVEVIAGETKYTGDIVIPSEVTLDGKKYNVTSIGENAFNGCRDMSSVSIPNTIKNVGLYAFDGCTGLTAVYITDIEAWCKIDFAISTSNPLYYAHNLVLNKELLTDLEIPNTITEIKNYTFNRCYSINSVLISNSVTSIGDLAFYGCNGLNKLIIPNSVKATGKSAFRSCVGLKSVIISDSVITISDWTFAGCYNVTNVEIGNSVTVIGNDAFNGCSSLTSIVIPDSVTEIFSEAFGRCTNLKSLIIGKSVSLISSYAFLRCDNLEIIECNAENCRIISDAFSSINTMSSLIISENVKSIEGFDAFSLINKLEFNAENCKISDNFSGFKYLNTVIIGKNVTNIPFHSISADNIVSINVDPENTLYDSRDNCNAIIETATNTLISGCNSTIIPNSVTTIGEYSFEDCTGLTSITIPNSVTTIGTRAFFCTGLASVTIPSTVTNIEIYAFAGCTGLTSVTSLNPTPPTCEFGVFEYVNTQNIPLTVPAESIELYKSADTWKDFGTIVGGANISIGANMNMSGVEETLIDNDDEPIEYYNLNGVRVQNPDRGVYIKRQGGRATKVVL